MRIKNRLVKNEAHGVKYWVEYLQAVRELLREKQAPKPAEKEGQKKN